MTGDLIACRQGNILGRLSQAVDFEIRDPSTTDADQVWVGVWPVAVITVAIVAEAEFKDLPHLLEQRNRLIDRGQAGHRELLLHTVVDLVHTRMFLASGQDHDHRPALWGEAVPLVSQSGDEFIYAGLRTGHRSLFALLGAFVDVLDPIS